MSLNLVGKGIGLTLVSVLVIAPIFALAHGNGGDTNRVRAGSAREVHIGDDGRVLVRGATVTSVSGSTVTATSAWGSASLTWTFTTDGSTEFLRVKGSGALSDVAPGHLVSVTGTLNQNAGPFAVAAAVVKDWSTSAEGVKISGRVESVNSSAQTFILSSGSTTVSTSASTTITLNGTSTSFGAIVAGMRAKVIGTHNAAAQTLSAREIVLSNDTPKSNNSWRKLLNARFNFFGKRFERDD